MVCGFAYTPGYMLTPGTTIAWAELPSCVTSSLAYYHLRSRTPLHKAPEGTKEGSRG
jgi:hypothetical protein